MHCTSLSLTVSAEKSIFIFILQHHVLLNRFEWFEISGRGLLTKEKVGPEAGPEPLKCFHSSSVFLVTFQRTCVVWF